jgi:hypothetical protein
MTQICNGQKLRPLKKLTAEGAEDAESKNFQRKTPRCKVVAGDGRILAERSQAAGPGFALAEVARAALRSRPTTGQPPARASWHSYLALTQKQSDFARFPLLRINMSVYGAVAWLVILVVQGHGHLLSRWVLAKRPFASRILVR